MLYIVAKLYGHPGKTAELRAYEGKVLSLFRSHGGEVIAAFVPVPDPSMVEHPDEVHVLRIADRPRFEAFLSDPARQALSSERESALRMSEVSLSDTLITY